MLRRRKRGVSVISAKELGGTTRRIYCSNTCAARAYRQRKLEAYCRRKNMQGQGGEA
jgi:hypothetical protein